MSVFESIRSSRLDSRLPYLAAAPADVKTCGSVLRLITTRNDSGDMIDESYVEMVADHDVTFIPYTMQEIISAEQLKFKATHKVHPLSYISGASENDFYLIDGSLYRITRIWEYGENAIHFHVWDGAYGTPGDSAGITKVRYVIQGVGPGVHTFGSGLFASVPTFSAVPDVWGNKTNDSGFYIASPMVSGFTLVDRGIGEVPVVTIYIFGTL